MSWSSHISALRALRTRVEGASVAAVAEAQAAILSRALELVPRDKGVLAGTGFASKPAAFGGVVRGVVSFGSAETQTPWRGGTGYELIVELGAGPHIERPVEGKVMVFEGDQGMVFATTVQHPGIEAVHFLETATLEAMSEIPSREARAFREALL